MSTLGGPERVCSNDTDIDAPLPAAEAPSSTVAAICPTEEPTPGPAEAEDSDAEPPDLADDSEGELPGLGDFSSDGEDEDDGFGPGADPPEYAHLPVASRAPTLVEDLLSWSGNRFARDPHEVAETPAPAAGPELKVFLLLVGGRLRTLRGPLPTAQGSCPERHHRSRHHRSE